MSEVKMTEELANFVYDILMAEVGATEYWRENFVQVQLDEEWGICKEYRFQGVLGFGGKFRRSNGRWYVDCYPEDESPERLEFIKAANRRLQVVYDDLAPSMRITMTADPGLVIFTSDMKPS